MTDRKLGELIFIRQEGKPLETVTYAEAAARACNAIFCRLNGIWDCPALEAIGPLAENFSDDVAEILDFYGVS